MIRAMRPAAALLGAAVALSALTGCVRDNVSPAVSWLAGQDGVAEASAVVDSTSLYGSGGVVRGELEDGLDEGRLDGLVDAALGYAREHPTVRLWLGVDDVDFVVAGDTASARELWADLRELDGIVAALVSDDEGVRVHVLRPALAATVAALGEVPAAVDVEGFRTAEEELADRRNDATGPAQRSDGSFQFLRGADCAPSAAQWERFTTTAAVDDVDSGGVDACGDYDLTYRDDVDLSAVATGWAAAQGASADPVPSLVVKEDGPGRHEIAVSGDGTLFPVVAAFEAPAAPVVDYGLGAGGGLALRSSEVPAGELLAILAASPLAERLSSISLEGRVDGPIGGESVTAMGSLADLAVLVAEAEALIALDASFYQVAIDPDAVSIDLYAPPGSDPDMAAAAAALRSSPIWTTRDTYVNYLNGYVLIAGGVATIGADYTDRAPHDAFIAAWNAG